jgi:isopenicillin N synthase-like dioxygenase
MAADIAVVSFERFLNGNDEDRRVVAKEIYDAFSTVGWVYVKDHGVDGVGDAFSLVRNRFYTVSRVDIDGCTGETVL